MSRKKSLPLGVPERLYADVVKILAIGKGTQDVFLKSDEFDPHKEGKHMYTHLPLGLKMEVEDVHFCTGGNATNVAVTFARQ